MSIADMFNGMDTAPVFGKGQWFGEGKFLLKTKMIKGHKGHNGNSFIAEFEVLESQQQPDAEGKLHDPVGSTRSWVVMMNPTNKNAFSDIKAFAFALTGKDPKTVGQPEENPQLHAQATQVVKCACDAEYAKTQGITPEMFVGRVIGLQTHMKPKKSNPSEMFTVHNFFPVAQPD